MIQLDCDGQEKLLDVLHLMVNHDDKGTVKPVYRDTSRYMVFVDR